VIVATGTAVRALALFLDASPATLVSPCLSRVSRCVLRVYMAAGEAAWRNPRMAVRTREIYRSAPNGDRWLLGRDPDTGRVFVRHEPNLPSGGQVADIELGAFLIAAGSGPEKQELLRLIGTLV
jgi:hypothetical protein